MIHTIYAVALLCRVTFAPVDCDVNHRDSYSDIVISKIPCVLPTTCMFMAQELVAKTSLLPRNGGYWKFTAIERLEE